MIFIEITTFFVIGNIFATVFALVSKPIFRPLNRFSLAQEILSMRSREELNDNEVNAVHFTTIDSRIKADVKTDTAFYALRLVMNFLSQLMTIFPILMVVTGRIDVFMHIFVFNELVNKPFTILLLKVCQVIDTLCKVIKISILLIKVCIGNCHRHK